jgi:hypothetical protein
MPKMISTCVTRAVFCNSDGSVSICTFLSRFGTRGPYIRDHISLVAIASHSYKLNGVTYVHEETKGAFYKG